MILFIYGVIVTLYFKCFLTISITTNKKTPGDAHAGFRWVLAAREGVFEMFPRQ